MIITKVISGGQCGADVGGLFAAEKAGIPTGGFAPRDWMTESGPAPWLADYGLVEHSGGYRDRTIANVEYVASHKGHYGACLWFGRRDSNGGKLTLSQCRKRAVVTLCDDASNPQKAAEHLFHVVAIGGMVPIVLMVAGNRESSWLGIGERAELYCTQLFNAIKGMK